MFHELKNDRQILRRRVHNIVCKQIEISSKGGHLPSFDTIITSICEEIAAMMDQHPELDSQFWSIILQAKEPDMHCEKFRAFTEKWQKLQEPE